MKFVWVMGMRGPTPELWSNDYSPLDLQKQPKAVVLQSVEVLDVDMTLEELALRHPLENHHAV